MYEPLSRELSSAPAATVSAEDLATDIEMFFDAVFGDGPTARLRRIDATFAAIDVPPSILRICNERADRFFSALSHYLHASSLKTRPAQSSGTTTLSFVLLHALRGARHE
jgi:hypothetical protein